ncbi:NAD(P)/FAD-dependent oxidoreductase [Arenibacter certesii]|uniref:FAD-dependent oxidoreductase n=1 Tax=Arenibacter certesii TaxID=228955 RepID=A0A918MHE0_9FLAO|nr:FAD-dependent oxidoreductase [Arenibacter certesii]GGW24614.1 FAD-dependent oxidoreductase [Arenibacter certesii]
MSFSYWEYKTWLSNIDFTIVGSGIVGLNCALQLKYRFPKARILVLERGILPQGASTKNAGFTCFGSISEVLSDLLVHTEKEVVELVQKRWEGVQLLRKNLGDAQMDYKNYGGHEVFLHEHQELYERCLEGLGKANGLLKSVFKSDCFTLQPNVYHFKKVQNNYISSSFEAQIDTGMMMDALLRKVQLAGVNILNGIKVKSYVESNSHLVIHTDNFEFKTQHLFIATNGFAAQLIKEDVRPARAQVMITDPIKNLPIKGTFHLEEGYYYFRNIGNRILLGGGRNLDFKAEETSSFGETPVVQNRLEEILRTIILPNIPFQIDQRWSGIMGIGSQKKPIVKQLSNRVYCGVRMGGMGIAIGSGIGKELADLV